MVALLDGQRGEAALRQRAAEALVAAVVAAAAVGDEHDRVARDAVPDEHLQPRHLHHPALRGRHDCGGSECSAPE